MRQSADLVKTLGPVRRRPFRQRTELVAIERKRHRIGRKPASEKPVDRHGPLARCERSDRDPPAIRIVHLLEQDGRFDTEPLAQGGQRASQRFVERIRRTRRGNELGQQRRRRLREMTRSSRLP